MTTTMLNFEPTSEVLADIEAITDPVARAWAAESFQRTASRAGLRDLADQATALRADTVTTLIKENYDDGHPLAQITDPVQRAWLAAAMCRAVENRAKEMRDRRDLAAFVLVEPFVRAVTPTNIKRREAKAQYEQGELTYREYTDRLKELLAERHANLKAANVIIEPADVYKQMGVSRARLIQMLDKIPAKLPRMRNASQVMTECRREVDRLAAIQTKIQVVRDDAIRSLLTEHSNAEIARLTGLTTARIAQIRTGTR